MKSKLRFLLAATAVLTAGVVQLSAQVSLRGFYTASINGSLSAVITVHNNNALDAFLFDSGQHQVGKAAATLDASGNFTIAGEIGYGITGTLTAEGASSQITGSVTNPSWSAPVSFTAPRTAFFGVGEQGTPIISGRFDGKAVDSSSDAATDLTMIIDSSFNLYVIHRTAAGTYTGGTGTVVANSGLTGGTFTYTTVSGGQASGTFTTDAFTMSGTLVDPAGSFNITLFRDSAANRLGNISTRGFVGTGQNILISGFVIEGGPKLVLIRVLGPGLAQYGITGPLADPKLTLYQGQKAIATNTGWQNQSSNSIVTEIQQTLLEPPSTGDDAILIQLEAGSYTAEVVGASGDTGTALAEVYEVLIN